MLLLIITISCLFQWGQGGEPACSGGQGWGSDANHWVPSLEFFTTAGFIREVSLIWHQSDYGLYCIIYWLKGLFFTTFQHESPCMRMCALCYITVMQEVVKYTEHRKKTLPSSVLGGHSTKTCQGVHAWEAAPRANATASLVKYAPLHALNCSLQQRKSGNPKTDCAQWAAPVIQRSGGWGRRTKFIIGLDQTDRQALKDA